jgi:hypothetical protein
LSRRGTIKKHEPLDGPRARARFEDLWIRDPEHEVTLIDTIEIVLKIWNDFGQDEILDPWSEVNGMNNSEIFNIRIRDRQREGLHHVGKLEAGRQSGERIGQAPGRYSSGRTNS